MSHHGRVTVGSRLFLWAAPGLLCALLVPASSRVSALFAFNLLLVLAVWLDARRLLHSAVQATRDLPARLCVEQEVPIVLSLANASQSDLTIWARDETPSSARVRPASVLATSLKARQTTRLTYHLTPQQRGQARFANLHLRLQSRWGLAAVDLTIVQPHQVRVMPASFALRRAHLRGPRDELGDVRARLLRAPQAAGELESLREYVMGDSLRSIDWNATARRGHPITRVFQPERSQTLWLVLDASRTMATTLREEDANGLGARTRFDVALEAALDLARRALSIGDRVGAIVYAERRVAWVPPRHGRLHERVLIDALCDVMPDSVQLDVRGLVAELERSAHKRSLIVLFTDLDNETHGQLLSEHAPRLQRKHITLLVSLDDAITQSLANAPADSEQGAYLQAAAADQLRERASLRARLVTRGMGVLEANESRLFAAALDRYLVLKTSQRL